MKVQLFPLLMLFLGYVSCKPKENFLDDINSTKDTVIVDSTYRDSLSKKISLVSDRHTSVFSTPARIFFYSAGSVVDSSVSSDFRMSSGYFVSNDTITLVAHVSDMETTALMVQFVDEKVNVFLFRAPHRDIPLFRRSLNDTLSIELKVPPASYTLVLSEIPDTVRLPVIFGHVKMTSSGYYDQRDSLNEQEHIEMEFYFRSQYRKLQEY